ncbi:unnamed protein product [Meloidogyne enterolobii]|uniref:Uncharacterized protein n=1 Tax=Meloidogyne enterolobii TaxID=390850 RepID=A0ACB0YRS5_MELEN
MPHSNNNSNSEKIQVSALPQSIDEGPSPFVQQDVSKKKLVMAKVNYLDDSQLNFHIHKNALGSVLLDLVIAQMGLMERDYFGLTFYDDQKLQHWLYPDKKIKKQLKGVQLEFFFKVKFYPPNPTQLLEDFSRHLLYLQLRKDVYSERLPVSFAAQASLGSLVAQAELGDYQPSENYAQLLSSVKIAQLTSEQEQFCNKVGDLHKLHRGLTRTEAELAYLNECKSLAMYGIHLYPAKDSKNKPIQIGISSVGISIFNDQMRVHRFSWAGIIKIEYRKNKFGIRLKPGELDQSQKKSTTVSYALVDYKHAKLVWRCGVEHHVFFRLVQPETKHKNSFLSFGSARFRYTGRTNIQSQMVSQLFETNAPTSASLSKSKSAEMLPQNHQKEPQTPLNYMDEQLAHVQPLATSTARSDKKYEEPKKDKTDKKKKKNKEKKQTAGISSASTSSSSSSSSDAETEEIHIVSGEGQNLQTSKQKVEPPPPPAQQQTTLETCHEEIIGPEQVTTEIDAEGNIIKRVVRTEQIRHTVQSHSVQSVPVDENGKFENSPTTAINNSLPFSNGHHLIGSNEEAKGELVSSKVVTTGNRTVETLTYKTEKDGITETRVEHRITIHSNEEIDHDSELSKAILEATSMNPELKVEKVEVSKK